MLPHPYHNKWQINHTNLYPLLGINAGGHLPKEGFPPREINGVMFKCDPAPKTEGKSSKHRVRYLCSCGKWIPFGRAIQHESSHK
jgi:hypothetical protein